MGRGFGVSSRRWKPSPGNSSGQPLKPLFVRLGFLTFPAAVDGVPGAGRGARFQMGYPAVPGRPGLWQDGWDGIWCGFRGWGCPFPPHPIGAKGCAARWGAMGTLCHPRGILGVLHRCGFAVGSRTGAAGPCWVSDPAVASSRTRPSLPHPPLQTPRARLCQATALALLPRRHRFPASLRLLGTTLAVSAAPRGAWDPLAPGEEAASLGAQEEAAAAAADTLRGPGSPPRKESAARAGDPQGAAGTGRPSLGGLWVGGGGSPLPRPLRARDR